MNQVAGSFSIALISLLSLSPSLALAESAADTQPSVSNAELTAAAVEAKQMVPAQALLVKSLNADKVKPGDAFQAKLSDTIHLKNGTELPHGTVLTGVVTTDQMRRQGTSTLALKFTEARLKDGKNIPIDATIIDITPPSYDNSDFDLDAGNPNWNAATLQVDQLNAESGIDLHSLIAGKNSGVFVSKKKDDVRLAQASILTLAIAPQQNQPETASSTGSAL